jgi:hypothetical protein
MKQHEEERKGKQCKKEGKMKKKGKQRIKKK